VKFAVRSKRTIGAIVREPMSLEMGKRRKPRRSPACDLPTWKEGFEGESRRRTRLSDLGVTLDALLILLVPALTAALLAATQAPWILASTGYALLAGLLLVRQEAFRRFVWRGPSDPFALVLRGGRLLSWGLLGLAWLPLFAQASYLALPAWWLGGACLYVLRTLRNRRILRRATLVTAHYRVFGLEGRPGQRQRKKLGTLAIYELPAGSPFGDFQAATSVSLRPRAFLGARLRALLTDSELRAVMTHELGHSLSGAALPYQLVWAGWHLLGLPLVALLLGDLAARTWPNSTSMLLASASLAWLVYTWVGRLLDRRIEQAADAFATALPSGARDLIRALEKLAYLDGSEVFPGTLERLGACSHPCIVTRMRKLCEASAAGGAGRG